MPVCGGELVEDRLRVGEESWVTSVMVTGRSTDDPLLPHAATTPGPAARRRRRATSGRFTAAPPRASGTTTRSVAAVDGDAGAAAGELVADAAARSRRQRLARRAGSAGPRSCTPSARPPIGEQADVARRAGPSTSTRPGPWRQRTQAVAEPRLDVDRRQPRARPSDEDAGQQVVEATAAAAHHHDPAGAARHGRVEGQLGVGRRPWRAGVARPACRRPWRPLERLRGHRVEVADHEVDVEAEGVGVVEARVGGDDEALVAAGARATPGWGGAPPSDDDARVPSLPPLALPRSGSRVGGGRPPSQPGVLRAPQVCGAPMLRRRRLGSRVDARRARCT